MYLAAEGDGALAGALVAYMIVVFAIAILQIVGMWKVFGKAGEPGWAAIVPIYNIWVLCKIAQRDVVWFILCLLISILLIVPFIDIAKRFGKGAGYGVGLWLLGFIFWPMLGFGSAQYQRA